MEPFYSTKVNFRLFQRLKRSSHTHWKVRCGTIHNRVIIEYWSGRYPMTARGTNWVSSVCRNTTRRIWTVSLYPTASLRTGTCNQYMCVSLTLSCMVVVVTLGSVHLCCEWPVIALDSKRALCFPIGLVNEVSAIAEACDLNWLSHSFV